MLRLSGLLARERVGVARDYRNDVSVMALHYAPPPSLRQRAISRTESAQLEFVAWCARYYRARETIKLATAIEIELF